MQLIVTGKNNSKPCADIKKPAWPELFVTGQGNWRKMKGVAHIRLSNGRVCLAELHWYKAHGIGKKEIKRKRYLE